MNTYLPSISPPAICSKRSLDNAQYHADKDVLSSSMLKSALVSPAHYVESLTAMKASTPQMLLGTLVHTLVLEPEKVDGVVALYPRPLPSNREGREFRKLNEGRLCLSIAEFGSVKAMAEKIRQALFRGRPFHRFIEEGEVEVSFYYADPTTGLACRTRLDLMHPEFTFDLKTTRHSCPTQFQRDAVALHYDLSVYMYTLSRVLFEKNPKPKPFVLVPAETGSPHSVYFMPCSKEFIGNGARKYAAALSKIKACAEVDHWPTLGGEVEMDLLPWQAFSSQPSSW